MYYVHTHKLHNESRRLDIHNINTITRSTGNQPIRSDIYIYIPGPRPFMGIDVAEVSNSCKRMRVNYVYNLM